MCQCVELSVFANTSSIGCKYKLNDDEGPDIRYSSLKLRAVCKNAL